MLLNPSITMLKSHLIKRLFKNYYPSKITSRRSSTTLVSFAPLPVFHYILLHFIKYLPVPGFYGTRYRRHIYCHHADCKSPFERTCLRIDPRGSFIFLQISFEKMDLFSSPNPPRASKIASHFPHLLHIIRHIHHLHSNLKAFKRHHHFP
jgi:hypothetical protein